MGRAEYLKLQSELKTTKEVRAFFAGHPVGNGGAVREHIITIEEVDDGDAYCRVRIPLWPQNPHVTHGVVKLLLEILKWDTHAKVFARDGYMEVHIYQSTCYD